MTTTQRFINQLQEEAKTTRKMLSAVPDEKLDWQPHPKSMTLRRLAGHIAELPGWVTMTMNTNGLDFANNGYKPVPINSREELLQYFEKELTGGIAALENAKDEDLKPIWTLRNGDNILSERPKEDVITMSISQIIHHRAQLGVFLRLLDIPIPGSYGPSADEMPF